MSKHLSNALNITNEQMDFKRGDFRELKVEVVEGDRAQVLINKKGQDFYTSNTPADIAQALKPYF